MTEPNRYGYSGAVDPVRSSSLDGIPQEVFYLSRMSRLERLELVNKLNKDLEQVQELRKKIARVSSDTDPLLPFSDIHSCRDGTRRPSQVICALVGGSRGKQRPPTRKDRQRSKKDPSRHSKSATSSTFASVMKECEKLLSQLLSHKFGWPFRSPVDPVRMNIPDYFTVIKHPMDFETIGNRLRNNGYSHPMVFAADVRLTLSNSMAYNPPRNDYHVMAEALSKIFERKWKVIEKKLPFITPLTPTYALNSETPFETAAADESKLRVEPANLVMTAGEKIKLGQDLEALEGIPETIINFLREHNCIDDQTSEAEIVINIDDLSDELLFMLRKLMDDNLMAEKNSQEKSEPCKIEIGHESGFCDPPLQFSKSALESDEDVDIVGGCDTPVLSYSPLKIEKDDACKNNESSSSSSDSDSSSSSGIKTDSNKASDSTSTEDKKEPGVDSNSKGEKIVVIDSLNELGQVGHGGGDNSIAMDGVDDVLQDEETAPPKTLVSSDRAALLKNRFADTIWKAREKSLTKGEKGDLEKLRIKRDEFEKWQRAEKIRLQAEAGGAEESRRKAEAEAAEEARRKREEEREAARQALEKMEKTVEINEYSQVMKDLEMLRTAADFDQLPISMEEMNPNRTQDVLGSFKMESSSNPLEKLGLYMKMDNDEDEEEEVEEEVEVEVEDQKKETLSQILK